MTASLLASGPFVSTGAADLTTAQLLGNTIVGLIDQYTGENVTLIETSITPSIVDDIIYFYVDNVNYVRVLPDGRVNLKWWGAKGDNATNDAAAFTAAAQMAASLDAPLFVPKGTYDLEGMTVVLPAKFTMIGEDVNNTVLTQLSQIKTNYDLFVQHITFSHFTNAYGAILHEVFPAGLTVQFDHCNFYKSAENGSAISSNFSNTEIYGKSIIVTNCTFTAIESRCIFYQDRFDHALIDNCQFIDCTNCVDNKGVQAIILGNDIVPVTDPKKITNAWFQNNYFNTIGGRKTNNAQNTAIFAYFRNITATNNSVNNILGNEESWTSFENTNSVDSFYFSAENILIDSNFIFNGGKGQGVFVVKHSDVWGTCTRRKIIISNNIIKGRSAGFNLQTTDEIIITGNFIDIVADQMSTVLGLIDVFEVKTGTVKNIRIEGNEIRATNVNRLFRSGSANNIVFSDNIIYSDSCILGLEISDSTFDILDIVDNQLFITSASDLAKMIRMTGSAAAKNINIVNNTLSISPTDKAYTIGALKCDTFVFNGNKVYDNAGGTLPATATTFLQLEANTGNDNIAYITNNVFDFDYQTYSLFALFKTKSVFMDNNTFKTGTTNTLNYLLQYSGSIAGGVLSFSDNAVSGNTRNIINIAPLLAGTNLGKDFTFNNNNLDVTGVTTEVMIRLAQNPANSIRNYTVLQNVVTGYSSNTLLWQLPDTAVSGKTNMNFNTWQYVSAAPVNGKHVKGITYFNADPDVNESQGWICVAPGTPGTFAPFGFIGEYSGTGTPESVVTAAPGARYTNLTGTAGTILYLKQSGTGNTGWVALG